jgi:3-hydroxyisobutyrate dehydrogenase-like beta-hydroxyacid dehydrogenase
MTADAIGFVGLGSMGGPIAEALLDAGHALAVCDARAEAAEPLAARGAHVCATPAEVAVSAETVLVSLPTPEVVREVACGENGLSSGPGLRTFVDLSTTGPSTAAELADRLAAGGVAYLDAPVSGGVAGARARTLAVMASGDPAVFERVRPLLDTFARSVFHVGPVPGQGQLVKLLNNLLSATAVAITCEATTFAVRAGLDPAVVLEVFNAGTGRNTATADKFPKHVLTRRFGSGFRLELMTKDVELCLAAAREQQVAMPVGGLVQQLWTLAAGQADEQADHTEIVRLYEQWAGVTVGAEEALGARG